MAVTIVDVNDTNQVFVNFGNDVYVSAGVLLDVPGISSTGIVGADSNHSVMIAGQVSGTDRGIVLGANIGHSNNYIEISSGGKVFGDSGALVVWGANSQVVNKGTVVGGEYGIEILSPSSSTTSSITNSGLILANQAILNENDGLLTVYNTGTIIGYNNSLGSFSNPTSVERVYNKGRMEGNMQFAGGNDLYDGRGGTFVGTAFGGAGDDTFIGGNGVERFNGGIGADKFTGGLGKDVLTMGTGVGDGIDKIIFNAVTEVGDIVTDFATSDFFQFKKSAFGNLALGTLTTAAYHENTTGAAHDASDRFIFETDSSRLWYDKDGTGSAAKVLVADMSNTVNISNTDIQII